MDRENEHRRWFEDVESFTRRVLTTVLFTDVVDSTGRLLEVGDRTWACLLATHHARFRGLLARFGGREVDAAGDGFLAAFDLATRAVACACALHEAVAELDLEVRSGVHTGECELVDGRLRGVAVHVGARVAAVARPGEVLVSSTVRDVVLGAGLRFGDRGLHRLRGPSRRPTAVRGALGGCAPSRAVAAAPGSGSRVTRSSARADRRGRVSRRAARWEGDEVRGTGNPARGP